MKQKKGEEDLRKSNEQSKQTTDLRLECFLEECLAVTVIIVPSQEFNNNITIII